MTYPLKICGIDPGTTQTAFVLWNGQNILDKGILPNPEVLRYLTSTASPRKIAHLTSNNGPDVVCPTVACEHLQCYGMPVGKEIFETAYWIGRYWQTCEILALDWHRVYRSAVKEYWCHSPKANDASIRTAIIDRLGAPGKKKTPGITYGIVKDLWSALAIAVYTHDTLTAKISSVPV